MWDCRVTRNGQGNNERNCFFLKEPNGGSTFGSCSCGGQYTDGIPCLHMVAVVKSSRIKGLPSTNSMPVWWTMECWCNQYPADTDEICHFDMDTLRSTPEDAAMRYCPPNAAPRKAGHPKNNKRIKSPLVEGKKKRALGVHMRPWWMTMKEKRKRKVTQHQHATQKGLEVGVNFEWVFFW
jgi:hypothetical protein